MKKLRLLVTKDCNNTCEGCCNKDWNLDKLPIKTDFKGYSEIMITGGEPLLFIPEVCELAKQMKGEKVIIYTASSISVIHLFSFLNMEKRIGNEYKLFAGLTLTIHTQKDVAQFVFLDKYIKFDESLSLRLNVFAGIIIPRNLFNNWKIKDNISWIKECPLPKDEIFGRITNLLTNKNHG